ncbi:MAG: dihydropteroate synthase [Caldilineales bacterium]|nr:dihydropteroate synthase [Caldilineales bacterium]MCW5859654.1 dihydropteroate synthase [Caldilineales bacterium]
MLINDQLRVYDQDPAVIAALERGDPAPFVAMAEAGAAAGCAAVDLLLDHPGLDERQTLPLVFRAVDQVLGCPILLDTRQVEAIETALDGYDGKAMLNSIVYERPLLEALLPVVQKHRLAVVAMLVDDVRIPETWQELGIGNAGFGMPDQTRLDLLYLAIAASWGLDAALVDYRTEHLALYSHGIDFLTGRDGFGQGYLEFVRRSAGLRARRRRYEPICRRPSQPDTRLPKSRE